MEKIRVAIVEDDTDWIKVMENFLSENADIEITGFAVSREEAVDLAMSKDIDVILMDINLNGKKSEGIFTVLDILEKRDMKIIMLTSMKDENIIRDSFTAGAVDYVLKENFYDVPFLIRRVHNRSTAAEILLKEFRSLKKDQQLKEFTPAEKEIFGYLEAGYNKSEIENLTYRTKNTIKYQIRSILRKLNVKTSKEAIKKVKSKGLHEN